MQKNTLSEKFVLTGTVNKVSHLNPRQIQNHCLSNFSLETKIKDDQFWHLEDYNTIPYHQHIQWFQDYIRDHYRAEYGLSTIPVPGNIGIRSIIQQTGQGINYHNHINPWNLEDSPEISCLYCVSKTTEPTYVIFKYDDGRNKHRLWKQKIEHNQFILFSSSLEHYITENKNSRFLVNLSTHYQLL